MHISWKNGAIFRKRDIKQLANNGSRKVFKRLFWSKWSIYDDLMYLTQFHNKILILISLVLYKFFSKKRKISTSDHVIIMLKSYFIDKLCLKSPEVSTIHFCSDKTWNSRSEWCCLKQIILKKSRFKCDQIKISIIHDWRQKIKIIIANGSKPWILKVQKWWENNIF